MKGAMLIEKYNNYFPGNVSFDWFMSREGIVFREMDGRKTLQFNEKDRSYFIKIHKGIGWKEIFKNLVQLKLPVLGAKNEFLAINKLTRLGLDTMSLVAYGQRGWNPATKKSFVVTEDLVNTVSLEDYCACWPKSPPVFVEKQILINKVARMTETMHTNGINHRDLYICHFLLKKNNEISATSRLFLIDLHRVQIRLKVPERWEIKDLSALYFSAMHIGLTKRDYLRFIKQYRGDSIRNVFKRERDFWVRVEEKAHILNERNRKNKKIPT